LSNKKSNKTFVFIYLDFIKLFILFLIKLKGLLKIKVVLLRFQKHFNFGNEIERKMGSIDKVIWIKRAFQ